MTVTTVQGSRTADTTTSPERSYSPDHLMAETYRALWELGLIPDGSQVDPYAAVAASADLLRAFGVTPAVSA
jgi:hypothetical protein